MVSTSAIHGMSRRTYLGNPNHPPTIPNDLTLIRTHHVVVDVSKRDLQVSATPGGPTRSHGRTEAESGESDVPDTFYMDHRWSKSDPRARYAKTAVLELPKDERAHLDGATTIAEPRLSKSSNHHTTARRDLTRHSTTDQRSPGPGPGSRPRQLRSRAKGRDKPYHAARLGPA